MSFSFLTRASHQVGSYRNTCIGDACDASMPCIRYNSSRSSYLSNSHSHAGMTHTQLSTGSCKRFGYSPYLGVRQQLTRDQGIVCQDDPAGGTAAPKHASL